MLKSLPTPDEMTVAEIEAIEISEWGWRKSTQNFVCKICGESAYLHPLTNDIWGCKKCDFTTRKIPTFFVQLPGTKSAEGGPTQIDNIPF